MPDEVTRDRARPSAARAPSCADLRGALQRAVASSRRGIARLPRAATTVTFRVEGGDAATLLLDRRPCEVVDAEPGEVELRFSTEQAARFVRGTLPMTNAIVTGRVHAEGPVRRFLAVEPVLRAALFELAEEQGEDDAADGPTPRTTGALDADLLSIETRGVHKAFGSNAVLRGLDLEIPEGAISVVLGPSGTGKSVLLQHVIGTLKPDAGEVLIRGRPLSSMSRSEVLALRRGIGVMFQDGALFSAMNVEDNVAFPLRQHTDLGEDDIREVVQSHLASVGLATAGGRMPNELSGGMRKRAGLARALVLNPGIVLCDEPDSGLDPVRTALLGDLLIDQHAEYGGTMVVVTHNVLLAKRIADHISVLWRGRVLESGMAEQVLDSPEPFVQQFLAGSTDGPLSMEA